MRFALRSLARTPVFTALAVLILAVGIGTNTTIFAIVDELAFRPTRESRHDNVYRVVVLDRLTHRAEYAIQIPDYEALTAHQVEGLSAIAAFSDGGGLLQIPGRAERVTGWRVSGQYARVFGVGARIGRWISEEDNAGGELDPVRSYGGREHPIVLGRLGADVAMISHRIWREWFEASPDVLRKSITLNGKPLQIIGVAPPGFETATDVWTPFGSRRLWTRFELDQARANARPPRPGVARAEPKQPGVNVMLRAAAGTSAEELAARLTAITGARPSTVESPTGLMRLTPRSGNDRLVRTGYIILGFAALIFIAACASLGNMLFARATEREGELALRLSLGSTRAGIFMLLFSETILICAAASAAGLLLSTLALQLFTDAFPAFQVSYWQRLRLDLSLDWRIVTCSTAAGAVAAFVIGAGSLWRSSRVTLLARLAASSQTVVASTEARTIRTMLVSVQVTAAVLLLIAAGMVLENTSARLNRRTLFDTSALVAATVELPEGYDESRGSHFFDQLLARVRSIDGVAAAGLTDALPGGEMPRPRGGVSAIIADAPARGLSGVPRRLDGQWAYISAGLIDTLGLRITRGRDFRDTDEAGSDPVVLISESTAARLWPGEDPLGKRVRCCGAAYLRQVVGVVPDPTAALSMPATHSVGEAMQALSPDAGAGVFVFLPAAQRYHPSMLVVARTATPHAVVSQLRDAVVALDPAVPVFDAGPVTATQFARSAGEHAVRVLAGTLGAIALGIAVFGVFAIVSYYVSRRVREFGLRLALGSTRSQIIRLVVDYAVHIMLIGLLPGVLFASLGTRYLQVELQRLHPNGLTVWVTVPLLMLAAGILAACIPARRAAMADPYRALREL